MPANHKSLVGDSTPDLFKQCTHTRNNTPANIRCKCDASIP
jgi:hypothetical protein